jgi:glycerophosphoryl diester phosphodiesterase
MKILGHRGINQPENGELPYQNTIEAINHAFNVNADGVELDVFISKDEKCFVIHDNDTSKHKAGHGLITELNGLEISEKQIDGKYKIPTLCEVLSIAKEKDKIINIEIKQEGIQDFVIKEVLDSKINLENIIISSFNHHDLFAVRDKNKEIKIGILFGKETKKISQYQQHLLELATRLTPICFMMEKTLPYISILESKIDKYFWTIKKEDIQNYNVQGLTMYENINFITDYPEELIGYIKSPLIRRG